MTIEDRTQLVSQLFDAYDYENNGSATNQILDLMMKVAVDRAMAATHRSEEKAAELAKHLVKGAVVGWAIERFGRDDILQIVEDWQDEDGDEDDEAA